MRKADRETESRKLIGEKLRQARMADDSPMTEEDAEYYRILAEARATHAAKENSRKSAKRHVFTSAAAILLILAVAGGGFILGMQSDVRASADPDDERKVVQQGDNIVISNGVSENYDNVGVVTKTYYRYEQIPSEILKDINFLSNEIAELKQLKVERGKNIFLVTTKYYFEEAGDVIVRYESRQGDKNTDTIYYQNDRFFMFNGLKVNEQQNDIENVYSLELEKYFITITIPTGIKIEAILEDLLE